MSQVTNVLETPSSRRRIVNIRDATGSIELKLWSQKVNLLSVANVEIEVTCVCVDQYLSRISLNSTVSTTVKVRLWNISLTLSEIFFNYFKCQCSEILINGFPVHTDTFR